MDAGPPGDQRVKTGPHGTTERVPTVTEGNMLFIPVENIGSGPALNLEARVTPLDSAGAHSPSCDSPLVAAKVTGLAVSSLAVLEMGVHHRSADFGFELTVAYEDLAGKRWETRGR